MGRVRPVVRRRRGYALRAGGAPGAAAGATHPPPDETGAAPDHQKAGASRCQPSSAR
jgi:hypothetical protein